MAEDNASKNQGNPSQIDPSQEVNGEAVDPKKAERAAKERERRRRRRRKKAELKRLQRETMGPANETSQVPESKPVGEPESVKTEPPKPEAHPKERHIVKRSEEHAPRSKEVEQPGKKDKLDRPHRPEKPKKEAMPQLEETAEEHPLTHKTTSFAGPLLEPGDVQPPQPAPDVEPELPPIETPAELPPPAPEAEVISEPEPVPDVEPEPAPAPLEKSEEAEEITIHNDKEEKRPHVNMEEVQDEDDIPEVPSIFPYPPQEEPKEEEKEEAEVVEPVKKPEKRLDEEQKNPEDRESSKETLSESEGLNTRRSAFQGAAAFSAGVMKNIGNGLKNLFSKFSLKGFLAFLALMVVGGGLYAGYIFKLHEKAYDYVIGFFKAPPPVEVNLDEKLLREWGITTAYVFGDNRGSTGDLLASQLFNAYYFGNLSEPRVQGETGITPAYIYGLGLDVDTDSNRFIEYVKHLRALVSVYDVDVYAMLDETTNRDEALNKYLDDIKAIMEKSTEVVRQISAEIDDTTVSYNSLSPEKTRFETDFFVALQGLAGEKADFLMKSFIDVSQKQTALKARIAALEQLLTYYETSMARLAIRITSIEKNYKALVQGIKVVDIPGANLDIIIREN